MKRFSFALSAITLIAVVLFARGWPDSRPAAAAGNTITSPDTGGNVGLSTSLALDASGHPVISYYDATNGDLRVLHCGDANCTGGNSITSPDTAGPVGLYSSLKLDASGRPVVSYWDVLNGDLKVLHCGNPNCTAGNSITSPDTAGYVGTYTSVALDSTGNPIITYYDVTNLSVKLLHCGNPNCTAGNSIAAPAAADEGAASISLDSLGNPVVAFNGGVLHCGNTNCTAGNSIAAVLGGRFNSLALDASGNPIVGFVPGYPPFTLLRCGNPTCTAGNITANPDPEGSGDTSLALDASGRPVVAYNAVTGTTYTRTDRLRVLHCGNVACTSDNTISYVDTMVGPTHNFDLGTSIQIDSSGFPVVSYYDPINGDLKVLHCGDPACKGPIIPTPTFTDTLMPSSTPTLTPSETPCPTTGCPTPTETRTPMPTATSCLAVPNDHLPGLLISSLPYADSEQTACADVQEYLQPTCYEAHTIWYSFTPSTNQILQADTTGSTVDTLLAVYTNVSFLNPNLIACDDNGGPGTTSLSVFSATAGTTYYIQVSSPFVPFGKAAFHLTACAPACSTPAPTFTPTATPPGAPGLDFSIGIDTNGDQADDCRSGPPGPAKCTVPLGSTFTMNAYLNSLPTNLLTDGYAGVDLHVSYSGVTSNNNASNVAWPPCAFAATNYSAGLVVWGCAALYTTSTYTGLVGTNDFACAADGMVTLLHGTSGTDVTDETGDGHSESGSESLTINCLAATPTRTPHPPPLGGVADYPNVSGGSSAWPYTALGFTIGLLALGGMALYARRRSSF